MMSRKTTLDMQNMNNDIVGISKFTNKLYYVTFRLNKERINDSKYYYFNTDSKYKYLNFAGDFGPLSLSELYKYCNDINNKLKNNKIILQYSILNNNKNRLNSAYLIGCYAIIYLKLKPNDVYKLLNNNTRLFYIQYQDANNDNSKYKLDLIDCFNAIYKAKHYNLFNFNDFNIDEYDKYEKMENGDMSWIVPNRFLAFSGPNTMETYTCYHSPEFYVNYFLNNNIQLVIRLNQKNYDENKFLSKGIDHIDLYFPDGSSPPNEILRKFMSLVEKYKGPIAVHCKAGLGRTGCLIGAYLVKYYKLTAMEAIGWMRICRPGCVIGPQQDWLKNYEIQLKNEEIQNKNVEKTIKISKHRYGIYSIKQKLDDKNINFSKSENLNEKPGKSGEKVVNNANGRLKNKENKSVNFATNLEETNKTVRNIIIEPKKDTGFKITIKRPLSNLCKRNPITKIITPVPVVETQADRLLLAKKNNGTIQNNNNNNNNNVIQTTIPKNIITPNRSAIQTTIPNGTKRCTRTIITTKIISRNISNK